jgi:hypothetical protein
MAGFELVSSVPKMDAMATSYVRLPWHFKIFLMYLHFVDFYWQSSVGVLNRLQENVDDVRFVNGRPYRWDTIETVFLIVNPLLHM